MQYEWWRQRIIRRLCEHLRLPSEARAHFHIRTWPGSRDVTLLVDAAESFSTGAVVNFCMHTFGPAKIEHGEIVSLAEKYKWQP